MGWMLDNGQGMVEPLSYARLPQDVAAAEKNAISKQLK